MARPEYEIIDRVANVRVIYSDVLWTEYTAAQGQPGFEQWFMDNVLVSVSDMDNVPIDPKSLGMKQMVGLVNIVARGFAGN